MKISTVEAMEIRLPESEILDKASSGQTSLIVKVHTDEGIVGIGEIDSCPRVAKAADHCCGSRRRPRLAVPVRPPLRLSWSGVAGPKTISGRDRDPRQALASLKVGVASTVRLRALAQATQEADRLLNEGALRQGSDLSVSYPTVASS